MTVDVIDYSNRTAYKADSRHGVKRPLHQHFINNDKSQGLRVTWVDGLDDPSNDPAEVARKAQDEAQQARRSELRRKLRTRGISQPELLELLDSVL